MNDELKPCPFCRTLSGHSSECYIDKMIWHIIVSSLAWAADMSRSGKLTKPSTGRFDETERWNTRPIEDDLRNQLAEKDAEIVIKDTLLAQARVEITQLKNEIASTRAELSEPFNVGDVSPLHEFAAVAVCYYKQEIARLKGALTAAGNNVAFADGFANSAQSRVERITAENQRLRYALNKAHTELANAQLGEEYEPDVDVLLNVEQALAQTAQGGKEGGNGGE